MVIEEAVVNHMENDGPIAAIVGDRIYPNVIPQDVDLPAIAYQVISRPGLMCHDGPSGIAWPRFQITAQANDYDEVVGLINLVRVAFDGFYGGSDWRLFDFSNISRFKIGARTSHSRSFRRWRRRVIWRV